MSSSDRGAVLVHVALALVALLAFSAFAVDYGVLWASRRQAQNAADAAALAGAVAFAYDSIATTSGSPADLSAQSIVQSSRVWGQAPVGVVTLGSTACPTGVTGSCVRVDVYRDTAHGNALPMFFGTLAGVTSQGIRATATAIVEVANATDCLKPWGVIDKWSENYPVAGPWTITSTYDKYISQGPNAGTVDPTIIPPDNYVPPTTTSTGTGFHPYDANHNYTTDYGLQLKLKVGDQTDFQYASGWFAPLNLFDSRGGNDYLQNIKGCVGVTYKIGDQIPVLTNPGNKVGPTRHGVDGYPQGDVDSIVNQDPNAVWSPSANSGHGGVINSAFPVSPRIVAVPLVDPDQMSQAQKNGLAPVTIANIMGFFVEGYDATEKAVVGRLMTMPGLQTVGSAPIGGPSAFLQSIVLIR